MCPFIKYSLLISVLLLSFSSGEKESIKPDVEERIDEFIEAVMECGEVPGLSLGVVRDGEVGERVMG